MRTVFSSFVRPTRREALTRAANGFGAVALAALLGEEGRANDAAGKPVRHHAAKAKSVIFLYMDGGPSQIDTFDYKPLLEKYDGKNPHSVFKVEPTQFNNVGKVMASPWKFAKRGKSGLWVSELFPHVAKCVDDLAVVRSMVSKFPEHTSANYFLHTGAGVQGRPSMGAWAGYGLGSENRDWPAFIVLNRADPGRARHFQQRVRPPFRSVFRAGTRRSPTSCRRTGRAGPRGKLDLLKKLDSAKARYGGADEIESAIGIRDRFPDAVRRPRFHD